MEVRDVIIRYLVIIEGSPGSRGIMSYSAFSPDVLGCVATGRTREEVEWRMHEALQSYIEWMLEDGDPLPEPHTSPNDPIQKRPCRRLPNVW